MPDTYETVMARAYRATADAHDLIAEASMLDEQAPPDERAGTARAYRRLAASYRRMAEQSERTDSTNAQEGTAP